MEGKREKSRIYTFWPLNMVAYCNWDEKGFLIGLARTLKRVMTKKIYDSGRITTAKLDSSREFISLLASICADGTALLPALIYKGASGDL
jgi:hypothetical protein